jgi:glycosyltransferase involved in cell wall biosynthesis
MLKILINAYACAPNRGSEPGMGWNWIINLANYCEVFVITEGEWQKEIEEALTALPQSKNITFYYNPVSEKVRKMCWNQGDWRFYYFYKKWQKKSLFIAQEIIQIHTIDLIHQLNMIGFREPGFLWKLKEKPFVWGPIGGMNNFPLNYLENVNWRLRLFSKLKNFINLFQIKYNSQVKSSLNNAQLLISAIPETQRLISKYHNLKSILIPETGCYFYDHAKNDTNRFEHSPTFDILWVGKFDFRKQLEIALKTLAKLKHLPAVRFQIVGTGDEAQNKFYTDLATSLGLNHLIIWHKSVSNDEVLKLMNESHLFFFTSVSEDTSTVVMEALSCNLPVLCFNTCGFGPVVNTSVGITIELSNPNESVKEFAKNIDYLYHHRQLLSTFSKNCYQRQVELSWDNKALTMIHLYQITIDQFKQYNLV